MSEKEADCVSVAGAPRKHAITVTLGPEGYLASSRGRKVLSPTKGLRRERQGGIWLKTKGDPQVGKGRVREDKLPR